MTSHRTAEQQGRWVQQCDTGAGQQGVTATSNKGTRGGATRRARGGATRKTSHPFYDFLLELKNKKLNRPHLEATNLSK